MVRIEFESEFRADYENIDEYINYDNEIWDNFDIDKRSLFGSGGENDEVCNSIRRYVDDKYCISVIFG